MGLLRQMSGRQPISKSISFLNRIVDFLSGSVTPETFMILSLVAFGFLITLLSLTLYTSVTPSASFGESIEGVVPAGYWLGIAIMVVAICYTLTRLDAKKLRIPFLLSCIMLIFSMRSALSILSPFPYVQDTWVGIYINASWRKYGILSLQGLKFLSSSYVRAWPASFILAYLITYAGLPFYTFYKWAPIMIFLMEVVVIYFLFKELANEKIGMVSAFLFTLLNTDGFFPLHYSAQTVGALLYLVAMYAIVKAYKTRKLKHLSLAFLSIFATVLTHHMTTLFLGLSLAGAYLSKYLLRLQQKMREKKWLSFNVKLDTFVKFSLPLSVFTFALWYFYGFIVYRVDATWMLTEIVRLLTTHQPRYQTGYYGRYLQLSPLSQLSILVFPAFITVTAAIFLFGRMLRRETLEGYLWLTMGWAGALSLAFIFGNLLYGNYIEPLRAQELLTIALFPASASFLLRIFESESRYKKGLITITLIVVAFLGVFSIYRGAQSIVYFEPPWWMKIFNPP